MYLKCISSNLESILDIPNEGRDHLITRLNISMNSLENLNGIERYPNLRVLYCDKNKLTSLDGLQACSKLQVITCNRNRLTRLIRTNSLIRLYCEYNLLESLHDIEGCKNLEILCCGENRIRSLLPLIQCKNLKILSCRNNRLVSLKGVISCSKLIHLNCKDNKLITLNGLGKRPQGLHYSTDYFSKEYNPIEHIRIMELKRGLQLVHKNLMPIYLRKVSRSQQVYRKYCYGSNIRYKDGVISRLCHSDITG